MFRWKATAAVLVAATLALTACSQPATEDGSSTDSGAPTGTLTLVGSFSPSSLDAAAANWGNTAPFYQATYDTLLRMSNDGEVGPFLATDWSYDDTNTSLTLTLRDDVEFTDGSKLTSEVVKENLLRFQSGTSPAASSLARVSSVETPDDVTVVINLSEPDPALLAYLTRDAGTVASGEAIADDPAKLATDPIGSGPYVLDTATTVTGSSYVYTINEDYWNPELQHYAKIVINVVGDPTAALNIIKSGEANAVRLANNQDLAEIEGAGWSLTPNYLNVAGLLLFDRGGTMNPALGDVRVRQAINYAFDREGMLNALQKGAGKIYEQTFGEGTAAYDESLNETYGYDPEKAKKLMKDAGYADGFTLDIPTTASISPTQFNLITQQLAEIGITTRYTDLGNNFIAEVTAGKWAADTQSLEQNGTWQLAQFMLAPEAIWNPFRYQDDQVDEYLEIMQYGTQEEQDAAAKALNRYVTEEAWFAWWYRPQVNFATDANTTVTPMSTNSFPAIYDFVPKS